MSALRDFLDGVKASGADRKAHWQVSLVDGSLEGGEIVQVLADAVVLRQVVQRKSANTRYQSVQTLEDVVNVLIPFGSIKVVRVLEKAAEGT